MRKYYQAALAIITVISLISFLFYRHEYNKLHYVLEVFNYFGVKNAPNCTSISNQPSHILSEPLPSWLRIDDNLFLYSSFNIDNKQIRTIAFGKIENNLRCAVYFADDETADAKKKSLIYSRADFYPVKPPKSKNKDKSEELEAYYLICEFANTLTPIGVKYFADFEDIQDVPIMAVKSAPTSLQAIDCAICVLPTDRYFSLEDKVSFVSVHSIVGIQHFLIYGNEIDSWFSSEMKKNVRKAFTYETVPWNFPFTKIQPDTIQSLIQADCLLRTRNVVKYAMTIRWTDFIIARYHDMIEGLLFDLHRYGIRAPCYSIKMLAFCTQIAPKRRDKQIDTDTPTILKFTMAFPSVNLPNVMICKPHEVVHERNFVTANASKNLTNVHRYDRCLMDDLQRDEVTFVDDLMLKFETAVLRSIEQFKTQQVVMV